MSIVRTIGILGHGERLVTTALKAMGDSGKDIVVATKGGLERPGGNWTVNGHPDICTAPVWQVFVL